MVFVRCHGVRWSLVGVRLFKKVSDGLRRVSEGLGKMSDSLGKVSEIRDGLVGVSHDL